MAMLISGKIDFNKKNDKKINLSGIYNNDKNTCT